MDPAASIANADNDDGDGDSDDSDDGDDDNDDNDAGPVGLQIYNRTPLSRTARHISPGNVERGSPSLDPLLCGLCVCFVASISRRGTGWLA